MSINFSKGLHSLVAAVALIPTLAEAQNIDFKRLQEETRARTKVLMAETQGLKEDKEKLRKSIEEVGTKIKEMLISGIKEGRGASLIEVIFRGPKKKTENSKQFISVAQTAERLFAIPEDERDGTIKGIIGAYLVYVEDYENSQDDGKLPNDDRKIEELVDAVVGTMRTMQIAQSYLDGAIKYEDVIASLGVTPVEVEIKVAQVDVPKEEKEIPAETPEVEEDEQAEKPEQSVMVTELESVKENSEVEDETEAPEVSILEGSKYEDPEEKLSEKEQIIYDRIMAEAEELMNKM